MSFKIDILIIYSSKDNISANAEQGWITQFQKFLNLLLQQVMGENPNILLKHEDDKISGANLADVAIVVPVLSKAFIETPRNLDLLEEFVKTTSGKKVPRIFKVLKQPLNIDEQPAKLRDLLPYELYAVDPDTEETKEYNEFFSEQAEHDFWMKMVDLAYDIYESLLILKDKDPLKGVHSILNRRTIYLAETGHDLAIQRNIIKRELQRHGYKVLPDHTLPANVNALKANVKEELDQCDLSIHLIGNSYGEIPEASDRSILDIQNQLAIERNKNKEKKFLRLIWIPTDLKRASERQRAFIDSIKRDTDFAESSGIFQTPLEDFKNILREELMIFGTKKKLNLLKDEELTNGQPTVYVMHDKVDEKDAKSIISHIQKAGYKVVTPEFNGELLDLRQAHINNLQRFDAAIIYQNKVNDQWVRMKLLDLLKAPGFGRSKPIRGRAVISEKNQDYIKNYVQHDIMLINGEQEHKMDSLDEFLKHLN